MQVEAVTTSGAYIPGDEVVGVQAKITGQLSLVAEAMTAVQAVLDELALLESPQRGQQEDPAAHARRLQAYQSRVTAVQGRLEQAQTTLRNAQALLQHLQGSELPAAERRQLDKLAEAARKLEEKARQAEQLLVLQAQARGDAQKTLVVPIAPGSGVPFLGDGPGDDEPPPEVVDQARARVAHDYGPEGVAVFDRIYQQDLNQEYGPVSLFSVPIQYQQGLRDHVAVHSYYEVEAFMAAQEHRHNPDAWGTTGDANAADLEELKQGDSGDTVVRLQNDLVVAGYMLPSVVNGGGGNFGDLTDAALRQFQRENGIPITGVVDAATVTALEHPRPRPQVPANGPALEHQDELGLTTGPLQELADGSTYQPFENGYVYVNSDNVRAVRTFDGTDIVPPEHISVFTSLADADEHYVSQWGESPSFQDDDPTTYNPHYAPDHFSDCGPTSGIIALSALGLIPHPSPTNAPDAIVDFRSDTGVEYVLIPANEATGAPAYWQGTMSLGNVETGIEANGGVGTKINANLEDINAALGRGHPVILGGKSEWVAWGQDIDHALPDNFLNHNTGDPQGHIIAVLGMTPEGNYIVADPLMRDGCILVSPERMQTFLSEAFIYGAMEVSRPVSPS